MFQNPPYQSMPNQDHYPNYGAEKPVGTNPPPEESPPRSYPPPDINPPQPYPPPDMNPPPEKNQSRPYPPPEKSQSRLYPPPEKSQSRLYPPPDINPPRPYPPSEKSPPWSYPPPEKSQSRPYPSYDQQKFRDVYTSKQTSRPKEKLGFTMRNLISQSCLFRLALALASLGGWIAAIFTQIGLHDLIGFTQFSSIRAALMAFMVWSYFIAIILFFLDWLNLFNVGVFVKVPINRIILGLDCITFCGVAITSIIGFIRGRQIPTTFIGSYAASNSYRIVAFYIASIFGFVVCVLLIVEICYLIIKMIFKGRKFSFLE